MTRTQSLKLSTMLESEALTLLHKKKAYEDFSRRSLESSFLQKLVANNRCYRHVGRFFLNILMFLGLLFLEVELSRSSIVGGLLAYPVYLFFQALVLSGLMIHAHELSHRHIKIRWVNDLLGILSGVVSFVNFYSFQYAHRLHHRNIGDLDSPEAGAPISPKGQNKIRKNDRGKKIGTALARAHPFLWVMLSWPVFLYYGDYSSWLLPVKKSGRIERKSLVVFVFFAVINVTFFVIDPVIYGLFYLPPMLIGGSRILAITYLHHTPEGAVFFEKKLHHIHSVIMANSDRNYGPLVNFFMMNNGYHIPHHINPAIAYYDLKRASQYLRSTLPEGLCYHYIDKSRLYGDLVRGVYNQRLAENESVYRIQAPKSGGIEGTP